MQLNQIYFERLKHLVSWLSDKAEIPEGEVVVQFNSDTSIVLMAFTEDEQTHTLRILGDQLTYNIKKYVNI